MKNTHLPALSIIEILIATGLISAILTAMAINMIYTQRAIADSELRTKATDQAESCLNSFRGLRDSNSWNAFCNKVRGSYTGTSNGTEIKYGGTVVCKSAADMGLSTTGNTYSSKYNITGLGSGACSGNSATITITVNYTNFRGDPRSVTVSETFSKLPHEAGI